MDKSVGLRTAGDGIDNTILKENIIFQSPNYDLINLSKDTYNSILKSLKPVELTKNKIQLIPRYVPCEKKGAKFLKKPREPKFVPYEPYKAAVKSLKFSHSVNQTKPQSKVQKNDVEIQRLVGQVVEMRVSEMNKLNVGEEDLSDATKIKMQWAKEKQSLETDIKNLKETNSHLENQLKFQAQVNSELKTLLVAAVGEDLESRVQHLTEDKLALARALLNSANHLTSHQEQTEWLSGQCEVWRSKFLASSLMVEELAKWKYALSHRIFDFQEVTKNLLTDFRRVHSISFKTYNNLKVLSQMLPNTQRTEEDSKQANVIDTAVLNEKLCNELREHLKFDKFNDLSEFPGKLNGLTISEAAAEKLLQNPVGIASKPDILCKAVMGAANSVGGNQMFLQHPGLYSCCAHCKGEIKEI